MKIKKVLICGLGALGLTYASKLKNVCELKILVDENRLKNLKKNKPTFNNCEIDLDYILPEENWNPDLIIISTKSTGLDSALKYLKNFAKNNTIIISLINGISSEDKIASIYKESKVIKSYFIGHSAIRKENKVTQDGEGTIVIEKNKQTEEFFTKNNINFKIADDIIYSQWVKFGVNIILNQPSAIYQMSVGEMKKQKDYYILAKSLLKEVKEIAEKLNIKGLENFEKDVFEATELVSDTGITSMYQDIMSKRKTEVDIFAGEIIKLGKKFNILTPCNLEIYNKIKEIEDNYR